MKQWIFFLLLFTAVGLKAQPKLLIQSKAACPMEVWVQTNFTNYDIVVGAYTSQSIYLQATESPCIIVVHDGPVNYIKTYYSCATGTDAIVPVPQCLNQFSPVGQVGANYFFRYWLQP